MTTPRARAVPAALALVASALLLVSCADVQKPDVVMTGVNLRGISTEGIALDLLVDVSNPNGFSAHIGELEYTVYLDDLEVAAGDQGGEVNVPAESTVEVAVPFTIAWEGMDRSLRKLLDGEEHRWRLKGRVEVAKGPLRRSFAFSERGRFKAPEVSDIEIDLDL